MQDYRKLLNVIIISILYALCRCPVRCPVVSGPFVINDPTATGYQSQSSLPTAAALAHSSLERIPLPQICYIADTVPPLLFTVTNRLATSLQ